jgi:hypothetical protein
MHFRVELLHGDSVTVHTEERWEEDPFLAVLAAIGHVDPNMLREFPVSQVLVQVVYEVETPRGKTSLAVPLKLNLLDEPLSIEEVQKLLSER